MRRVVALVLALLASAAPAAWAQDHQGLMVGVSLGAGGMASSRCRTCEPAGGLAVDAAIGGSLRPRLALMGDMFSVVSVQADGAFASTVTAVALQYWMLPALWVRGGIGLARLQVTGFAGAGSDTGVGVSAAIGHEVVHDSNFSVDVRLRFAHGRYDGGGIGSLSALLAVSWY